MDGELEMREAMLAYLLGLLPPGRRPEPRDGEANAAHGIVEALAAQLSTLNLTALRATLDWLPGEAQEGALEAIGAARGVVRRPGEYAAAYRSRVLGAVAFWELGGTVPGMRLALTQLGYGEKLAAFGALESAIEDGVYKETATSALVAFRDESAITHGTASVTVNGVTYTLDTATIPDAAPYLTAPPTTVVEHWRDDPAHWAEFSVYVSPTSPEYTAPPWGGGTKWGAGATWGVTISPSEPARIRAAVSEMKPAHAKLRKVFLILGAAPVLWGGGVAKWGDGNVWGGANTLEI